MQSGLLMLLKQQLKLFIFTIYWNSMQVIFLFCSERSRILKFTLYVILYKNANVNLQLIHTQSLEGAYSHCKASTHLQTLWPGWLLPLTLNLATHIAPSIFELPAFLYHSLLSHPDHMLTSAVASSHRKTNWRSACLSLPNFPLFCAICPTSSLAMQHIPIGGTNIKTREQQDNIQKNLTMTCVPWFPAQGFGGALIFPSL